MALALELALDKVPELGLEQVARKRQVLEQALDTELALVQVAHKMEVPELELAAHTLQARGQHTEQAPVHTSPAACK